MSDSKSNVCLITYFFISLCGYAQPKEAKLLRQNSKAPCIQYTQENCYSRSILVVDNIAYTANSNGSIYKTDLNTMISMNILKDSSFEELRDLYYANGMLTAVQSGASGKLVRTDTNKLLEVFEADYVEWKQLFIDGVDLKGSTAFLMGDPLGGNFQLYKSTDHGTNWHRCEGSIAAVEGEAGFAASGTNVQVMNDSTFIFVSGGKNSRFFRSNDAGKTWSSTPLAYISSESSGAFSICMTDPRNGVIVGGDYQNPNLADNISYYTFDGGKVWTKAETQPRGYRSCVIFFNDVFYSCGTNGIDYSLDHGRNWKPFANGTFMALITDTAKLYATMPKGSFQIFDLLKK
jgi:photosystem II stability/assembly factor-like uncharacterized protein